MKIKLTPRLMAITKFIEKKDHVADIGSDHGLLPLYLAENGVQYIYASDNKKGPYERLKSEIEASGHTTIRVDLADGLDKLPLEVDTLVIAGMGGELIAAILSKGVAHLDHLKKMILVPHGQEEELRKMLSFLGFMIQDEVVIEEDGKFYELIYATNEQGVVCGLETFFGPINIRKKSATFIKKWQAEYDKITHILKGELPLKRRMELETLLNKIGSILPKNGDKL